MNAGQLVDVFGDKLLGQTVRALANIHDDIPTMHRAVVTEIRPDPMAPDIVMQVRFTAPRTDFQEIGVLASEPLEWVLMDYDIKQTRWGIEIRGNIPVSDIPLIAHEYGMNRTSIASGRLATRLHANLVFCNNPTSEKDWWKHLEGGNNDMSNMSK